MTVLDLTYVLPILREAGDDPGELTSYLRWLAEHVEVIVVDGSPIDVFGDDRDLWSGFTVHLAPNPRYRFANGKVSGVHTGIDAASHERIVIADDDVRYDVDGLREMSRALESADLVRPQNYFEPLPWHARWDTARSLLNRCLGSDSPGTLGVRRSRFRAMGGYDGDVLYENLELVRTVEAAGGRVANRPDLYVRRVPPTARRFFQQRPRQAYDDFAQPWKLALFLSMGPLAIVTLRTGRGVTAITGGMAAAVAMAEVGRRRWGGRRVFGVGASWWAPAWVLERSVFAWAALIARMRGGARYGGRRVRVAAHSPRRLRARVQFPGATGPDVASVAHRGVLGSPTPA